MKKVTSGKSIPPAPKPSKANYKSGGMYSTGRAIPPAPGTKAARSPRKSADAYGSPKKKIPRLNSK